MTSRVPSITIDLSQSQAPMGQCSYCSTTKAVDEFVKCHCNLAQYCDLRCKKLHGRVHRAECVGYGSSEVHSATVGERFSAYKNIRDEAGAFNKMVADMLERKDISYEEMRKFMAIAGNRLDTLSIQLQRIMAQDPFQPK